MHSIVFASAVIIMAIRGILVVTLLCIVLSPSFAGDVHGSLQHNSEGSASGQTPLASIYINTTNPLLECRFCTEVSECLSEAVNTYSCQCDAECTVFNDCCASFFEDLQFLYEECKLEEANVVQSIRSNLYKCNSLVTNATQKQLAVYMVSQCPQGWSEEGGEETSVIRGVISDNCIRSSSSFPPVSDFDTGLIYSNEYCALCHNISSPVIWSTVFSCSSELSRIQSNETLTPQVLSEFCSSSHFSPPSFHFMTIPPRFCTPSISTCLSEGDLGEVIDKIITNYKEVSTTCQKGPQNLVTASSYMDGGQIVFRNEHCALCNGYHKEDLDCFNATHTILMQSELELPLLLDVVNKIAHINGTDNTSRLSLEFASDCPPGSVFDAYASRCRETVCTFVKNGEVTGSNNCADFYINFGGGGNTTTEASINSTVRAGAGFTCQSVVVIEDTSEYFALNQTLIFYKPLGVITLVIGVSPNGLPIVCLDLAIPFLNPETIEFFLRLQKIYGGLLFATSCVSVVLCAMIIIVYFLRPMHSVFGVVVINITITFIVSDIVLILVGHSAFATANQNLCVFAAIAEQLISLAFFVWLAIFAVDLAIRYHRNVNSLQPHSKKRVVITYLLVGWTIPLALTIVGIAANFATRGTIVQYGLEGNCHISHAQSALALFVIPDLISVITAAVALVVILILLCKARYSFDRRDKCRFVLLFIFYPFLTLLWFMWFSTLSGGPESFIKQLFLPVLFLFRSIFFFFMVAFSKKVLKSICSCCGVTGNKINPSESVPVETPPEYDEGQRDSIKSLVGTQNEQHTKESFASHLENPMPLEHTRTHAWQEVAMKDLN